MDAGLFYLVLAVAAVSPAAYCAIRWAITGRADRCPAFGCDFRRHAARWRCPECGATTPERAD